MTRRIVLKLFLALIVGVVCCATLGCGNSADEAKWPIGEERDMDAFNNEPGEIGGEEEGECESDEECGEDAYCHEPSDCTSPTYCEDGLPPISAAPPTLACGCNGRVKSMNAGYPGRYKWEIGFGSWETFEAECDADAEFPVEWAIRLVVPDERPAGLLYRFTWSGQESVIEPVPDDGMLAWEALGDASPGFDVRFLLDADGDGTCSDGDDVWLGNVAEQRVDLVSFEIEGALSLLSVDRPCEFW